MNINDSHQRHMLLKRSFLGVHNMSPSDFTPFVSNASSSKMRLFLILLLSCFPMMFCNITQSQFNPHKLSELTTRNLFQLQLKILKLVHPIIAYDELIEEKLILFGYEIANLQDDAFSFIQMISEYFSIKEVTFRYFFFGRNDNSISKIMSLFKLTVTNLSFENSFFSCYLELPDECVFSTVVRCRITSCIASTKVIRIILQHFTDSLKNLFLRKICEPPTTCIRAGKDMYFLDDDNYLNSIEFPVNFFFDLIPNLEILHLQYLDFPEGINFSCFTSLQQVSLNNSEFITSEDQCAKITFPKNIKFIDDYDKCCLDNREKIQFLKNGTVVDLKSMITVFITPDFDLNLFFIFKQFIFEFFNVNEAFFNEMVEFLRKESIKLQHLRHITIKLGLTKQSVDNMLKLLHVFPSLKSLSLVIVGIKYDSFDLKELFSDKEILKYESLSFNFLSSCYIEDLEALFIFEMTRISHCIKKLEFRYSQSNYFTQKVHELMEIHQLRIQSLDQLSVKYSSHQNISLLTDLQWVSRFDIKELKIECELDFLHISDNPEDLLTVPNFEVEKLSLNITNIIRRDSPFFRELFSKFSSLVEITQLRVPHDIIEYVLHKNNHRLKKLNLSIRRYTTPIDETLNLVPLTVQKLKLSCRSNVNKQEIIQKFRKRFENAYLSF